MELVRVGTSILVSHASSDSYFSARKNTPKKRRLISQAPFPIHVIGQIAQ